ncbi:hypothetical protein [Kyrpidia spormannii]|uniref:hypothetical protein n=1 Tax=Kyrpidia spormannii TaxID=2055160 RepID=UPI001476389D|nr:hypothetical protein [Kyrpidia spormannii]
MNKTPNYDFILHRIDYTKIQEVQEFPSKGEYEFTKGYIALASQREELEKETVYSRATTSERRTKRTLIQYQMFTVDEVAEHVYRKLNAIDVEEETNYSERYNFEWLKDLIRNSLRRIGESRDLVSEENRQRIQKAFGVLHRKSSYTVRYRMMPNVIVPIRATDRPRDSVGISALRHNDCTIFFDDNSFKHCDEETRAALQEILHDESLPRSAYHKVDNTYLFKTPLNIVIADHKPERDFIRRIISLENAAVIDAWMKSTDRNFYSIEYAWRKGEHMKRGTFNPDFFIKVGSSIVVVEIKGDEELYEPSEENKGKYKAAKQHFRLLNDKQNEYVYQLTFLTPKDYDLFFRFLRERNYSSFVSNLDAVLNNDYINSDCI